MKTLLQVAGGLHFVILIASALTPRVLNWRANFAPLHPFLRRLFWVYGVFIVLVIFGFGILTLANAEAMATGDPVARSLAAFIGVFWLARLAVQWFVFAARPFLTNAFLRLGYHGLTLLFIILVVIYFSAAFL